jgi:hypothetical protein
MGQGGRGKPQMADDVIKPVDGAIWAFPHQY